MSEEFWVIVSMIIGVSAAVAVACWATSSGIPLFGLLMLGGISVKTDKTKL
jgi:hypothetical protein